MCEHAAAREAPGQKHTMTFKDEADCCMKEEFQDVVILGGFTGCLKKVLLFPVLMFFHSHYNFSLLFGSVRSSRNANLRPELTSLELSIFIFLSQVSLRSPLGLP